MKKVKLSELGLISSLKTADRLLAYSDSQPKMLRWSDIMNTLNINPRNHVLGSRTNSLTGWATLNGTRSLINDSKFGTVVQWERTSGTPSDYQKEFQLADKGSLSNTTLVFFVIAKRVSTSGTFFFGGNRFTKTLSSDTANNIDLGDGWYVYWTAYSADDRVATSSNLGLNSMSGTWQFYAVGINIANMYSGWQRAWED